jgi:hypothetical protein
MSQQINNGYVGGRVDDYFIEDDHSVVILRTAKDAVADGEPASDEYRAVHLWHPDREGIKRVTDGFKAMFHEDMPLVLGVQVWPGLVTSELWAFAVADLGHVQLLSAVLNQMEIEGRVKEVDEETGIVVVRHGGMEVRISLPEGAEVSQNFGYHFVAGIPDLLAGDAPFTGLEVTAF